MTQDEYNKMETLVGYLEYFVKQRTPTENEADEISSVIDEANEYLKANKPSEAAE